MQFPRSSGVLLHPTSLPGAHGSGDFGSGAYHFVDWLVTAGQQLWQILPLCPAGMGNSPYMGYSAFAGDPMLIGLDELVAKGWIDSAELSHSPKFSSHHVDYGAMGDFRMKHLRKAARTFFCDARDPDRQAYESFVNREAKWLDDFALFMALLKKFGNKEWSAWSADVAQRKPAALKAARTELESDVNFWMFTQWCFYRQWSALKKYANDRGVQIVGDIPIFIAFQSADVWAHPDLFFLDKNRKPTVVAGVPPDYFSETGQRWGNPLYRWNVMERNNFSWWIDRIQATLTVVDIVRIDHFRGFCAYWEIPASEATAVHGRWVDGPKEKLFEAIQQKLGRLPIIAEDLGVITPDVVALREKFNFPGMKVLQFAFAGDTKNPFLPHNYDHNSVVYTGTHDNDTTLGWYTSATERERVFVRKYSGSDGSNIHWDLIRLASRSVANMSVCPFQDIIGLGTEGRMNYPGTPTGNWEWRFTWDQVRPEHARELSEITALYGRCGADRLELPQYPQGKAKP
jgi:4-alpha-glucanotransferase